MRQPACESGPFPKQRLVGDFDGGLTGGAIAVEREKPSVAEPLVDRLRRGVLSELGNGDPSAQIGRTLRGVRQPPEDPPDRG